MALFAIKDILSNPFRHIERYPIKPEKVEALRESLRTTGYWDNAVGRPKGRQVEIAYGHHRLEALKAERYDQVEVITRKLSEEPARTSRQASSASGGLHERPRRGSRAGSATCRCRGRGLGGQGARYVAGGGIRSALSRAGR